MLNQAEDRTGLTNNGRYSIVTSSNCYLDLADPRPEDICFDDIAGGLSRICRFAGQVPKFYSVAQHSINCVALARKVGINDKSLLLAILMHDAAEAYLGDISRPLKMLVPGFKAVERRVLGVIWEKFEIRHPIDSDIIKVIDNGVLFAEKRAFFSKIKDLWHGEEFDDGSFEINRTCLEPQFAEQDFRQLFQLLTLKL